MKHQKHSYITKTSSQYEPASGFALAEDERYTINGVLVRRLLYILIMLLPGCSETTPRISDKERIETIKLNFQNNIENYELLGAMVKEDFQGQKCFTVGLKHIGNYRYFKHTKVWMRSLEEINLDQVLEKASISPQKYKVYKSLFSKTGIEKATFCNTKETQSYTLLAHVYGEILSGCSIELIKKPPMPKAINKREKYYLLEIIPLEKEWYIKYECY